MNRKVKYYDEIRDFQRLRTSMEKTELVVSRLENPAGLTDEKILMYQDYLFNEAQETVRQFIDFGRTAIFPLLVRYRVIKKANIIKFTDYAREKKKTDILFYLMEAGNVLRTGGKNSGIVKKHIPGKTPLPYSDIKPDWKLLKPRDIIWLGIEPMPWMVLENRDGRLLLLSYYVFDSIPYKNFYLGYTTWSRSTLRLKLHTEYINELLNPREIEKIVPVYIDDEDDSLSFEKKSRTESDRLFMLSTAEVKKYMRTERERFAPATKKSTLTPMWTVFEDFAYWWLRSPGAHPMEKMYVRDGLITSKNSIVNGDDCFDYYGVRPAMYMSY